MPSALPDGEPGPASGELPESALALLDGHPFGIYVHVPFCSVRCGYCDFNTYTLTELGVDGASVATYADAALAELDLAAAVLGPRAPAGRRRCSSAAAPRPCWPPPTWCGCWPASATGSAWRADAEVTTEANPDSVTPESLRGPGRRRLHPRQRRHAVRGAARARDPRAHARPGQRRARRRRGPCRRARGERRPDLRHAGGVARRTGATSLDAAVALRARPRLGLRAGGRGGHQAGRPGPARAGARARGRRRGGQVRDRRRACWRRPATAGTRSATGRARRRPGAGTTRATGPTATGGASAPARTATSVACGGGTSSTPTPLPRASARGSRRPPAVRC